MSERRLIDSNKLPVRKHWYSEIDDYILIVDPDDIYEAQIVDAVEVVRCRDCKSFLEYSKEHKESKNIVEGADGDCFIRVLNSEDKQYHAVTRDDYCSLARKKTQKQTNI